MTPRPPLPRLWLALLVLGISGVAAAIGWIVWFPFEVGYHLLRYRHLRHMPDYDDWKDLCGLLAPEMRDQYARVLSLFGPWADPADPKFQTGGVFHNLKGCWCVWVGLSRERSGKLLAFVIALAIAGWLY